MEENKGRPNKCERKLYHHRQRFTGKANEVCDGREVDREAYHRTTGEPIGEDVPESLRTGWTSKPRTETVGSVKAGPVPEVASSRLRGERTFVDAVDNGVEES